MMNSSQPLVGLGWLDKITWIGEGRGGCLDIIDLYAYADNDGPLDACLIGKFERYHDEGFPYGLGPHVAYLEMMSDLRLGD